MEARVTELGPTGYSELTVERWRGKQHSAQLDLIAEEMPVVLVYNDEPHVVMMVTPLDLEDFALGFSLSEGVIKHPSELQSAKAVQRSKGMELRIRIPELRFEHLRGKQRNLTGRTGCGLCGASTLDQAIKIPNPVSKGIAINAQLLGQAMADMHQQQTINRLTGAVHAAAWFDPQRGIQFVREDVGRHNALDKLIGTLTRSDSQLDKGCLLVTSRASYEMVQKAATVGITTMAAVSAPTALAIRMADECGLTLIGFTRDDNHVVYTHPHRLQH